MTTLSSLLVDRPGDAAMEDDGAAIAELHRLHALQRAAFMSDPYPAAEQRKANLMSLAGMVMGAREQIRAAMSADFAVHPELFTDLVEVLGIAGRAAYAIEQLDGWMADEERHADPAFYGTARAVVRHQAKGVVGNIVPWNFPFDLSVGPLVEMLAAGNRVILKPSDYTPACADLLRRLVADTFPEELVAVSVGGLALAKEFPTLRWDHLLYTGSPAIGREIARAAAGNLVPVTLELGGKCPAVLTADSVDVDAVRNVIGTKLIKNGQMCISVDYVLVPRGQSEMFVQHAQQYLMKAAGLRLVSGLHGHHHRTALGSHPGHGGGSPRVRCTGRPARRRRGFRHPQAASDAGRRPAGKPAGHAGGDLRTDPAGRAVRRPRRRHRADQRR